MRPTRRFWAIAGAGVCLLVLAPLTRQPALFLGAVGIAAWLVVEQYRFIRSLSILQEDWTVSQSVTPQRITAGVTCTRTVHVTGPRIPASIRAELDVPAVVESHSGPTHLTLPAERSQEDSGSVAEGLMEQEATTTFEIKIAGQYTIAAPTLTVTDSAGLFEERLDQGDVVDITIEARRPPAIHIGSGGEQIAAAYGEHPSGHGQSSVDAAEVRTYQPGDSIRRIDWKTTARLHEPHVREFESQARRETILVVDHRETMGEGPANADWSKLTYTRDTALGIIETAVQDDDPTGLYTVGDAGLTAQYPVRSGQAHETRLRTCLRDLEPTETDTELETLQTGVSTAQLRAHLLKDDTSKFATTLQPLFTAAEPYVQRLASRPLFQVVETHVTGHRGRPWIVIFTDDCNRAELRETVKLARRGGRHVTLFICPSAFFEAYSLATIEEAYETYLDFEEFRRELESLNRVTAFEVAPSDRIQVLRQHERSRTDQEARE